MENAVDALKMAGSVLLFVMALSVSIVAFGQARQAADVILNYRDRETEYINGDYYYEATGLERTVSLETVIPSIFRAYSEQYKIVFEGLTEPLYTYKNSRNEQEARYIIDLDYDANIINSYDRARGYTTFLNAIIYGVKEENFSTWYETPSKQVILPSQSLYDRLKGKQIKEYLGVYYPSETSDEDDTTTIDTNTTQDEVPEANKQEKRIITYKIT